MEWFKEFFGLSIKEIFPIFISFVSLGLSFYNILFYQRKKTLEKKVNDLINVYTQLNGFSLYLENILEVHNAVTGYEIRGALKEIKNADKDLIDNTQDFYFNNFDSDIRRSLLDFFEDYIGWKGFKVISIGDIFRNVNYMYMLQQETLFTLILISESETWKSNLALDEIESFKRKYNDYKKITEQRRKLIKIGYNLDFLADNNSFLEKARNRACKFHPHLARKISFQNIKTVMVILCYQMIYLYDFDKRDKNDKFEEVINVLFFERIINISSQGHLISLMGEDQGEIIQKQYELNKVIDFLVTYNKFLNEIADT